MSSNLIFTDVRVFTGTEVLEKANVVVENGLIKSVGTGSPPDVPGAVVISKAGHTLLPGFIDSHIHADKGKTVGLTQSLRFGITTVMDMHNETEYVLKLKQFAKDNVSISADLKAAGLAATIDGGWPMPVVTAHDKSEEASHPHD
jgi:cytosine/adenosine deaminase-related metal-dependent hydrolase